MNHSRDGVRTCPWPGCSEPRSHGYCRVHHAEYMREWRKRQPGRVVWSIDREYAEGLAGQFLTNEQVDRFAEAIGNSSVPDALRGILGAIIQDGE